jgi:UDP-N-acetylmuramyl pentapeptide phosphotransferase/UDP-N-acetylglucosamine-1-phosphate transferase
MACPNRVGAIMIEIDIVLSFIWAFVIAVFAIPSIIYVAHLKNLLDEPNYRTIHASLTPRLGGLAIFAGFMSAVTIFGTVTPQIQRLLASCLILFFIGLKDDITPVSAFKKFFVQILATGIIIFLGDVKIDNFQGFLGIYKLQDGIAYGFTFLVIVGLTNAFNLIDGLDGLAGTIIMISAAAFGIYFYLSGVQFQPYAQVAFCLIGGIVGFLRYNLHKAIIFMGDTGSLVCGLIVSVLAIQFVQLRPVDSAPSIAVAILVVPIFDTVRVFGLRILRGKSPFSPDKNHVHHILVRAGISQLGTVAILAIINIFTIAMVVYFSYLGNTVLLISLICYFMLFSIILEYFHRRFKPN